MHASQQANSPIGFPSLKIPQPSCAVLLVVGTSYDLEICRRLATAGFDLAGSSQTLGSTWNRKHLCIVHFHPFPVNYQDERSEFWIWARPLSSETSRPLTSLIRTPADQCTRPLRITQNSIPRSLRDRLLSRHVWTFILCCAKLNKELPKLKSEPAENVQHLSARSAENLSECLYLN